MSELPDLDKLPTIVSWLAGFGVIIGGAVLTLLGYRQRKPAGDLDDKSDARDHEIARLQRELDARTLKESIEMALKATREALYFKLDQGFSGIRADIKILSDHVDMLKDDIQSDIKSLSERRRSGPH